MVRPEACSIEMGSATFQEHSYRDVLVIGISNAKLALIVAPPTPEATVAPHSARVSASSCYSCNGDACRCIDHQIIIIVR